MQEKCLSARWGGARGELSCLCSAAHNESVPCLLLCGDTVVRSLAAEMQLMPGGWGEVTSSLNKLVIARWPCCRQSQLVT